MKDNRKAIKKQQDVRQKKPGTPVVALPKPNRNQTIIKGL
jgi:hypothetical protein